MTTQTIEIADRVAPIFNDDDMGTVLNVTKSEVRDRIRIRFDDGEIETLPHYLVILKKKAVMLFNVGDRVRIRGNHKVGTVIERTQANKNYKIDWDESCFKTWHEENVLEKIDP